MFLVFGPREIERDRSSRSSFLPEIDRFERGLTPIELAFPVLDLLALRGRGGKEVRVGRIVDEEEEIAMSRRKESGLDGSAVGSQRRIVSDQASMLAECRRRTPR